MDVRGDSCFCSCIQSLSFRVYLSVVLVVVVVAAAAAL